jgi:hypothetical protein
VGKTDDSPDDTVGKRRGRWRGILATITAASDEMGERIAIDQTRAMASPQSSTLVTAQLEAAWEEMAAADIESAPPGTGDDGVDQGDSTG